MHPTLISLAIWMCSGVALADTIVYEGNVQNTTANQVSRIRLTVTDHGPDLVATLYTYPPLVGSGTLTGKVGYTCRLEGTLPEGFKVTFSGTRTTTQYGGTFIVSFSDGRPPQYGTFNTQAGSSGDPGRPAATTPAQPQPQQAPGGEAQRVRVIGQYRAAIYLRPSTNSPAAGYANPGTFLQVLESQSINGVLWYRVTGQDGIVTTHNGKLVVDGWVRSTIVERL